MAGAYYQCYGYACLFSIKTPGGVACDYYVQTGKTKEEQMTPEAWDQMCAGGPCLFYRRRPDWPPPAKEGRPPRPSLDERIAWLSWKAGKNDRQIAEDCGCTPGRILRWRRRNDLAANRKRGRPKRC